MIDNTKRENLVDGRESKEWTVGEEEYNEGLFDSCGFLCCELKDLMESEGRCFGIVKTYFRNISNSYTRFDHEAEEDDMDIYGRILYLFKPLILFEWKRLKKRLSPADACIVLLHKLLGIISEQHDFEYFGELRTIEDTVEHLFGNIRNRAKTDTLFGFSEVIKTYREYGIVGKRCCDQFSLPLQEPQKETLSNPGPRLDLENRKVTEIEL